MKIIQLQAENVKRLSAVSIKPDGSTVVIGGRNGQGKSSVLDAIMYALAGGESLPAKPLREGSDKGQVVVKLDGMTVTRRFTRKKDGEVSTALEIKRDNGDKASGPQAILDDLCGRMAFDPLEFSRLKPRAQTDALKQLVDLDFTDLDQQRAKLFERRADVNRIAKAKAGELASLPLVDAPAQQVSVADLMEELGRLQEANRAKHGAELKARLAESEIANTTREISRVVRKIEDLERQLAEAREELAGYEAAKKRNEADAKVLAEKAATMPAHDVAPLHERITNAESVNVKVRQNEQHHKLSQVLIGLQADAERLTAEIEAIDADKAAAMSAAPFPVAGLGFDASGITLNGLPFGQASSAEQLRVSVAMGLAVNPKLRVMLIRDGSLLDEESLEMVATMAEEADAQVWIERVGDGEEVSVVIEDGHVRHAEQLESASV